MLCKEENDNIRTLVKQLGWIAGQTRPGLVFNVCQLNSIVNRSKVDIIGFIVDENYASLEV